MSKLGNNEAAQYFEGIFNTSDEGIILVDHDGIIRRVNPAFTKILGYEEHEIMGKTLNPLAYNNQKLIDLTAHSPLHRFHSTEKASMETTFHDKGGNDILVRFRSVLIKDEHNQVREAIGILKPMVALTGTDDAGSSLAEKMWEAQQNFENVLNYSADTIIVCDMRGDIVMVNEAFSKILGYTQEELVGKHISEFGSYVEGTQTSSTGEQITIDEELVTNNANKTIELFEKGYVKNCEMYLVRKDKIHIPFEVTMSVLKDKDGERRGTVIIARDITERKKAEKKIRDSRDFLDNIFKTSIDCIMVSDPQGNMTEVNRAFLDLLGYTREEVIGKGMVEFSVIKEGSYECTTGETVQITQTFLDKLMADAATMLETGRMTNWELYLQRRDNKVIPVEENIVFLNDEEGEQIGAVGIIRDITERKRAEKTLKKTNNYLSNIIASSLDCIVVTDSKGYITEVNRAFLDLLGFKREEVRGKMMAEFSPLKEGIYVSLTGEKIQITKEVLDEIMANVATMVETGKMVNWQIYLQHRDNKVIPVEENVVFLNNEEGKRIGAVAIIRDITERKRTEKTLQKAHDKLEDTNKELKDFAYVVSHDLKAPLRAISQLANWVSDDYSHVLDAKGKEQMSLLIGRTKRMHNLIEGILHYSRLGRFQEKSERVSLNSLVKAVIATIAPPHTVQVTIDNTLPVITGDKTRFEQLFQNLLSNAVKFMDKPQGEVGVGCADEGSHWKFTITDNGPGIDEKHHEKIFQIFQTIQPRDEFESTGIGLTLVKKIVESYGGKIWVESSKGKGSTFLFTLPKKGKECNEEQKAYSAG